MAWSPDTPGFDAPLMSTFEILSSPSFVKPQRAGQHAGARRLLRHARSMI